jgi:hypothetical protein
MTTRTTSKMVTFARPFLLKGVDRILEAGDYRHGRRADRGSVFSGLPSRFNHDLCAGAKNASSVEMVAIDPQELQAAQERDQSHGA